MNQREAIDKEMYLFYDYRVNDITMNINVFLVYV